MDTESIVARAQAGDRSALGELIEAHQTQIYSLCLAIMRNPSDAADMTQETCVRLLRSVASFRGERATFRTWLHRLALNVCLDGLRRRRRAPASLLGTEELVERDHWSDPEWSAEWRESASEVRAALAGLPLPQRVALTLFYFDDSSYERIARVMALPMNTVKSHLLRGRLNLARLLGVERRQRLATAPPQTRMARLSLVAA